MLQKELFAVVSQSEKEVDYRDRLAELLGFGLFTFRWSSYGSITEDPDQRILKFEYF